MKPLIPFFFLLFACVGCDKPQGAGGATDKGLRSFLEIRSLSGTYTLPEKDTAYEIVFLQFENGKMVASHRQISGELGKSDSKKLAPEFLYQSQGQKARWGLTLGGTSTRGESEFWTRLDGGWASSLGDSEKDRHEGFVILGFAQSNLGQNGKSDGIAHGEFDDALRSKKYVGALAIRSAPTREELEKTERVAANR